jgi:hypothetical protein
VNTNNFPAREIDTEQVVWQALAAVIDGKDDNEAKERLRALGVTELRVFRFQVDRMRTLVYNVQKEKMQEHELEERLKHEAEVNKPQDEAGS